MSDNLKALQRLHSMSDWLRLPSFDRHLLMQEIEPFKDDWKPYNPTKPNHRFGLSVTSLDGSLSGIPDLNSLYDYNRDHATNVSNLDITTPTPVYENSTVLKKMLDPYRNWLGRTHLLKFETGGHFPEHYDIEKIDLEIDEIRLLGFVWNTSHNHFKFCYEDRVVTQHSDGDLFYFNASKRHSVFAMDDEVYLLVITLRFDYELFKKLLQTFICK